MTFHVKRSPSKAKQFLNCHGTLALCETLPPEQRNQSSDAARFGTATHYLIECALRDGKEPIDYEDRIILLQGDEEFATMLKPGARTPKRDQKFFIADAEMADNAAVMTDYVRAKCDEYGIDVRKIIPAGKTGRGLQLETRTNPLPERDDTSGTADVTIDAFPDLLELVDYKNGVLLVEHEDNDQTLGYLLGKAIERGFKHKKYCATIVQPRSPHPEGPIRRFEVTKKDLLAYQARLKRGIEHCEEAERQFSSVEHMGLDSQAFKRWAKEWLKPGDHCTFCEAAAVCPARLQLAQSEAQMDFSEEPRDIEIIPPTKSPAKRGEVTPDLVQVANILKWAPTLEALIRAANLYAQRALEAGYKVPGQKLVRGRSTRRWRADMTPPEIAAALVKGGFVKDKSKLYSAPKLLSGPQTEKLVPKTKRKAFNEKFLDKPEGALTVAAEDDPREAVVKRIGDDFEDDIVDAEFEEVESDDFDFG